jgi:hypothetical protein
MEERYLFHSLVSKGKIILRVTGIVMPVETGEGVYTQRMDVCPPEENEEGRCAKVTLDKDNTLRIDIPQIRRSYAFRKNSTLDAWSFVENKDCLRPLDKTSREILEVIVKKYNKNREEAKRTMRKQPVLRSGKAR